MFFVDELGRQIATVTGESFGSAGLQGERKGLREIRDKARAALETGMQLRAVIN